MSEFDLELTVPEVHGDEFVTVVEALFNSGGTLTEQEVQDIAEAKLRHVVKDWFIEYLCNVAHTSTRAEAEARITIL